MQTMQCDSNLRNLDGLLLPLCLSCPRSVAVTQRPSPHPRLPHLGGVHHPSIDTSSLLSFWLFDRVDHFSLSPTPNLHPRRFLPIPPMTTSIQRLCSFPFRLRVGRGRFAGGFLFAVLSWYFVSIQ